MGPKFSCAKTQTLTNLAFSTGSDYNSISPLLSQVGGRAVAYYMSTTVLAVILGIILVTAIRPGSAAVKGDDDEIQGVRKAVMTDDLNLYILYIHII